MGFTRSLFTIKLSAMAERPLDCSECKKPIAVCYTEIIGDTMTRTIMCADCPHLEKHLYGTVRREPEDSNIKYGGGLYCGTCRMALDAVRMGNPLGCAECYEVFADVLIQELVKTNKISRHLTSHKKNMPLHMGRAPGEITEINPTLRLIALNEALDETLIREDYEQAAMLRDQIRALKEKSPDGKE